MSRQDSRLDDAARAGWLYYVAGKTQDEIASVLGVSRQAAQRLVSLAVSEGLVRVRIQHPIARCLELAAAMRDRFGLNFCEIVPSDRSSQSSTLGVAEATAEQIERWLGREDPLIMGIGTGRTLRAAVENLCEVDCPQHKIVSLTGNIAPDGSAAYFNVVFTMADLVTAPAYPMPLPVIAATVQEREQLHSQKVIRAALDLATRAEVNFVGIGEVSATAPLVVDGFVSPSELKELTVAGAAGEILGWVFDRDGQLVPGLTNDRVASAPIPPTGSSLLVATAMGPRKLGAIGAAIRGGLINGLITDETTAETLLSSSS